MSGPLLATLLLAVKELFHSADTFQSLRELVRTSVLIVGHVGTRRGWLNPPCQQCTNYFYSVCLSLQSCVLRFPFGPAVKEALHRGADFRIPQSAWPNRLSMWRFQNTTCSACFPAITGCLSVSCCLSIVGPHPWDWMNIQVQRFCVLRRAVDRSNSGLSERCIQMALFPLMATGFRVLLYLDDWLLCVLTKGQAMQCYLS